MPSACGCHTWPGTPAQSHNCTLVPFAVPELETSRHRPEAGFLRLPLGCHCHTWFAAPVQLHSCTFVPFVVPNADRSRHLFAIPTSGDVGRSDGATPRRVPSDPTHITGRHGH